jgi:hypothetical protein
MPWSLADDADVTQMFDGCDVGIRYADDAVGRLVNKLADLGVLDDTNIWISSDHGEAFGELGVYADHQAADEATAHIPAMVSGPGIAVGGRALPRARPSRRLPRPAAGHRTRGVDRPAPRSPPGPHHVCVTISATRSTRNVTQTWWWVVPDPFA